MFAVIRLIRPVLAGLLVLLAVWSGPAAAGLVDFSPALLARVAAQWGDEAPVRLLVWQRLVRDMQALIEKKPSELMTALKRTHRFFNQVPFAEDSVQWNTADYWATPVELLGSFGGDCEDYAIAKFLTLQAIGIPSRQLRILYVHSRHLDDTHMVLAYYPTPEADPLILDNLDSEIRPASARDDLVLVYGFNDEDLWLSNGSHLPGGIGQVRLWQEMLERLKREQRM